MSSGAIAILIALAIMLAIIAAIAVYYARQVQAASPDKREEMNATYKRYAALAGVMFIAIGVFSVTQEDAYQGSWWFGLGIGVLGMLLLIAAWIGIPSWIGRKS